jgi:L-ascorbate metabolism protein UlaG (beta-lactamase superfamily)
VTAADGAPAARLMFIGTATTVLRIGPFTLLTDPNFLHRGQRAYLGKGLWSRRLTEPALTPAELPELDAVVLSHLHGDHFDRVAKAELQRTAPVLTTPQAARRLTRWGFETVPLRAWQTHRLSRGADELVVEAVPAVHARGVMKPLLPPVMGSVLTWRAAGERRLSLYLTGDTLLGGHLQQIAQRHPDLDGAVVHLGGTRVLGALVTLDGVGGRDLLRVVDPGYAVPVHHDDYGVLRSPLRDFTAAVQGTPFESRIRYVDRGASVSLEPQR